MYCHSCGTALPEDALFCSKCGAAQNAVAIEESGRRTRRRARGRGGPYALAARSPTRRHVRLALLGFVRYRHALEMRAEGMELFERAQNRPDLVVADARVPHALDALRVARDDLSHSLPTERSDA